MIHSQSGGGRVRDAVNAAFEKYKTDAGAEYKNVTWFEFAKSNDAVTLDATEAVKAKATQGQDAPNGGAILLGGEGADTITGAKGNDLILGGGGNDTILYSAGEDLIFGGAGDDTYQAGDGTVPEGANGRGSVTFFGGAGSHDKADYSQLDKALEVDFSVDIGSVHLTSDKETRGQSRSSMKAARRTSLSRSRISLARGSRHVQVQTVGWSFQGASGYQRQRTTDARGWDDGMGHR